MWSLDRDCIEVKGVADTESMRQVYSHTNMCSWGGKPVSMRLAITRNCGLRCLMLICLLDIPRILSNSAVLSMIMTSTGLQPPARSDEEFDANVAKKEEKGSKGQAGAATSDTGKEGQKEPSSRGDAQPQMPEA